MITKNNKSSDIINYQGSIKVSVVRGDKVVRKKTFKNEGRWPLFRHLVECLRGNYEEAEGNRPIVLGLFSIPYNDSSSGNIPTIREGEISSLSDKQKVSYYAKLDNSRLGSPGLFMTQPKIEVEDTKNIGSANITYTFLIPFSVISVKPLVASENTDWYTEGYRLEPLNLVCLYGKNNCWLTNKEDDKPYYGNPSAYFFVTENNTRKLGSLIPKDITALSAEYSLKIEWTLTLSNPSTNE